MEAHERPAAEGKFQPGWTLAVARAVLEFFDTRRRDLPWRRTRDPYRVWVSEVMLQQTRVETVIPYYERWLDRFPDLDTLASAPEHDVLHAWAGLGYYSRARNLHRAAQHVREHLAGDVPRTATALRHLSGVGSYTAGAIASIAFDEPVPAIDGNARRVLSRLHDADLGGTALHEAGRSLVPRDRPGDFNQGLMELGATICTPRPHCADCPLRPLCRAFGAGTAHLRPRKKSRPANPEFHFVTLVAYTREAVLLRRRSERLLRGLWCFPALSLEDDVASTTSRFIRQLLGARRTAPVVTTTSHAFTHRTEHYHVVRLALRAPREPMLPGEWLWTPRAQLNKLALPAAQQRIARLAL